MRRALAFTLLALASCSDPTEHGPTSGPTHDADAPLLRGDLAKTWVRLDSAPGAVFQSPTGFFAFETRSLGGARDAIYESGDGVSWRLDAVLSDEPAHQLLSVAFGNGRLVAVGTHGDAGEILTSSDGKTWASTMQPTPLTRVAFANGLFFAANAASEIHVSPDGATWTKIAEPLRGMGSAAYGNGTFVLLGATSVLTSRDGETWSPVDVAADDTRRLVFSGARFYASVLSSSDGKTWSPLSDRRAFGATGGYVFEETLTVTETAHVGLRFWQADEPKAGLVVVDGTNQYSGPSCAARRCVVVAGQLFLLDD